MNLEHSFEQLSITEDNPPRRPDLKRLNAQRGMSCHDHLLPPSSRSCNSSGSSGNRKGQDRVQQQDNDEIILETVFLQAQQRFPGPPRLPSVRSQNTSEEMSIASMGAQELEFYWHPTSGSTRSLGTSGSHPHRRALLQRRPTPPHLVRTLTMSSHDRSQHCRRSRPNNPMAWSLRQSHSSLQGLSRQSSLLTNDSGESIPTRYKPLRSYPSRHSSSRTFASQDTL